MALGNDDASQVVVRVVNWGSARNISIVLLDVIPPDTVGVSVLAGVTGSDSEQNTPWAPTEIAPHNSVVAYSADTQYWLTTNSFTIFSFAGMVAAPRP